MKRVLISIFLCSVVVFSQSNVLHAEFQFGKIVPTRTITLDGNSNDWNGIEPFISDPPLDWGCENIDIKDVYLAQDGNNLYWRMDLYEGGFPVTSELRPENPEDPPIILTHSIFIYFHTSTTEHKAEGKIKVKIWANDLETTEIQHWDGNDYITDYVDSGFTAFGSIAEGRIPISLFGGYQYVAIEGQIKNGCETGYCDIVLLPDLLRPDTDSDGIFDFWDECPSTRPNSYVNNNGCASSSATKIVVIPLF